MVVHPQAGGTPYNALAYYSPNGNLVARHRKLQPTNAERTVYGRGDGRDVFVVDTGFGRVGGLICSEHTMGRISAEVVARLAISDPDEAPSIGGGMAGFIGPDGRWLGEPHRDSEAIGYAEVDLRRIAAAKYFTDCAGHYARPDVFTFGINRKAQEPLSASGGGVSSVNVRPNRRTSGQGRIRLPRNDSDRDDLNGGGHALHSSAHRTGRNLVCGLRAVDD